MKNSIILKTQLAESFAITKLSILYGSEVFLVFRMPRPAVYKSKLCRVTRDDDDDSGAKGCRQLWARCCFAEGLSSFPDMSGRGCVQCAETVTCMWHYSDPSAFVRAPPMFVQSASEHLHEIAEVAGFVYTLSGNTNCKHLELFFSFQPCHGCCHSRKGSI